MKILKYFFTVICSILVVTLHAQSANKLVLEKGSITFLSNAPLERIEAKSTKLKGLILTSEKTFAFTVDNSSFEGFNGSLQQEHFNENYLESERYPKSYFVGKIVESIDFYKDGKYEVRAKGKLTIHGIEKEKIIKVSLEIKNGRIVANAKFNVLLKEYGIYVPSIVNQKIAEEIQVSAQTIFDKYE